MTDVQSALKLMMLLHKCPQERVRVARRIAVEPAAALRELRSLAVARAMGRSAVRGYTSPREIATLR